MLLCSSLSTTDISWWLKMVGPSLKKQQQQKKPHPHCRNLGQQVGSDRSGRRADWVPGDPRNDDIDHHQVASMTGPQPHSFSQWDHDMQKVEHHLRKGCLYLSCHFRHPKILDLLWWSLVQPVNHAPTIQKVKVPIANIKTTDTGTCGKFYFISCIKSCTSLFK